MAPPVMAGGLAATWTFDGDTAAVGRPFERVVVAAGTFIPSPRGQALHLTDSALIPDSPHLRLAPGLRLECRLMVERLPEPGSWVTLVAKGHERNGEYMLRVEGRSGGGRLDFFVNLGGWEPRVSSPIRIETGRWYHVSVFWDGERASLIVEGTTARVQRAGAPQTTHEPVRLMDGMCLDELLIVPGTNAQERLRGFWPLDHDGRDESGRGRTISSERLRFASPPDGPALRVGGAMISVAADSDLQLEAGLELGFDARFDAPPPPHSAIVLRKDGEYMVRLDPTEGGAELAWYVRLGDGWEPRLRHPQRIETGRWYRVAAGWNGRVMRLEVDGRAVEARRTGTPASGGAPLQVGGFEGRLANLWVENPGGPALFVDDWLHDPWVLRVGQPLRVSAVIMNAGRDSGPVVAELESSEGLGVSEGPARLNLGALGSGSTVTASWTVVAQTTMTATVRLGLQGGHLSGETTHRLAILPERDPDAGEMLAAIPEPSGGARTYYVDPLSGDNARDGATPETAWRDFTPINGRTLGPGERLLIRRGGVIHQELRLSAAGRPDAWAEIGAWGEGARPVLRGRWHINDRCALIRNPSHLRIRSLTFAWAGKGLVVTYDRPDARGLVIEDCIAHHIEGLYRFNSHGIPEWLDQRGAPDADLQSSAGIAVVGGPRDIVIRDCEMFQCSWGFLVKGDGLWLDRLVCRDNHVFNTSPHPAIIGARRAWLRNSVFDAAGYHAYAGTMGIMIVDCHGLVIENCHFVNQPDSGSHDQGGIDFEAWGRGCVVDRCTFRNNAGAAIEVLGLTRPQIRDVEIARSRFIRNNWARKLGPAEIFIWGRSPSRDVVCSRGVIRDNGYVRLPGVEWFVNEAPHLAAWALERNTEYPSEEELRRAMPWNDPPEVSAGTNLWTDAREIRVAGGVRDDGRPAGRLAVRWEVLHGPAGVTFEDASALATTARFAASGDYTLRLVADDGELWRSALVEAHVLPAGAAIERAWDFSRPLDGEGWTAHNTGTTTQQWEDCRSLPVDYVGGGHWIVAFDSAREAQLLSPENLGIAADRVPVLAIKLLNRTGATRMRVRWTTDDAPEFDGDRVIEFTVGNTDDLPTRYFVPMHTSARWQGRIRRLRLEFAERGPVTGTLRIDDMALGRWPSVVASP